MSNLYRRVVLTLFGLQLVGSVLLVTVLFSSGADAQRLTAAAAALIVCAGLLLAYWRGWEYARHADVVAITLLAAFGLPDEFVTHSLSLLVLVPPALALILTPPPWILGSALVLLGILLARGGGGGVFTDLQTLTFYWLVAGSMFLSRILADAARRDAQDQAGRAEAAREQYEGQALRLAQQAEALAAQNAQQQQLLELVTTLETPVVALADGVLLAPVVGQLNSQRAAALTTRLLAAVSDQHARLVVLDIAGVTTIDAEVARSLLQSVQALRLLGCAVTITGISAEVAMSFTRLGIGLGDVATAPSPQEALELFTNRDRST
jgi:anti-anti-sigma regulatory factor